MELSEDVFTVETAHDEVHIFWNHQPALNGRWRFRRSFSCFDTVFKIARRQNSGLPWRKKVAYILPDYLVLTIRDRKRI